MHFTSLHYRQLQPEDRMTLASFQQENYSILAMARVTCLPLVLHTLTQQRAREVILQKTPCSWLHGGYMNPKQKSLTTNLIAARL
jgi:hypothetical protein